MRIRVTSVCALLLLCASTFAHGAESVETFRVNLDPLIDRAAQHPSQFAVDVARRVTSGASGRWQIAASNATWDYAIRIPTAVSLAFHASRLILPADGTLTITAGDQTYTYRGRDLHRQEFWSRLAKGDQIALRIVVPKTERRQTMIEIASFQAGYKSLAPGLEDNAHFKAIKARAAQPASAGCVENYVCDASSATQSAANASIAVTIANTYECSGTPPLSKTLPPRPAAQPPARPVRRGHRRPGAAGRRVAAARPAAAARGTAHRPAAGVHVLPAGPGPVLRRAAPAARPLARLPRRSRPDPQGRPLVGGRGQRRGRGGLRRLAWIGTIVPRKAKQAKRNLKDNPFFGMHSGDKETVEEQMQQLRGNRYS